MKQVKEAVEQVVQELGLKVSDVYTCQEEGTTFLKIELDSDTIIDLNRITEASRLINPVIDKLDPLKEEYILDIYAKEKGEMTNEQ